MVEDNPGDARLVAHYLRRNDWYDTHLEHCDTLQAAIELLDASDYDALLIDLGLPDSDGVSTLERLREVAKGAPIVVLTGRVDDDLGPRAISAGAEDFVPKGSGPDVLIRSIRLAVTRARHRREVVGYEARLTRAARLAALGRLAAGVAHEINNPVSFVSTNLDEVRLRLSPIVAANTDLADMSEIGEMLDECVEGMRRIRRITRDLGAFARVSSDAPMITNLNEVIRAAIKLTRNEARHVAQVTTQLLELPDITLDEGKMTQVFVNLILNALHAIEESSRPDHRLEIETRATPTEVIAVITDTGVGVPSNVIDSVFDPFFTTKAGDRGTGLGLAICRDTVRRHEGDLEIASEVGVGTTITVRLPRGSSPLNAKAREASPHPPVATTRKRVLLVDDDPIIRRSLRRSLARVHDVEEAAGGREALEMLDGGDGYDVILCDLMMPVMDGAAVLESLKQLRPDMVDRVIFVSGGAFTPSGQSVVASGHLVLDKPVDRTRLLAAIADVGATT
jgi:signal transduction histidine kinase